jgi:hypothetical protein
MSLTITKKNNNPFYKNETSLKWLNFDEYGRYIRLVKEFPILEEKFKCDREENFFQNNMNSLNINSIFQINNKYYWDKNYQNIYKIVGETSKSWRCLKLKVEKVGYISSGSIVSEDKEDEPFIRVKSLYFGNEDNKLFRITNKWIKETDKNGKEKFIIVKKFNKDGSLYLDSKKSINEEQFKNNFGEEGDIKYKYTGTSYSD